VKQFGAGVGPSREEPSLSMRMEFDPVGNGQVPLERKRTCLIEDRRHFLVPKEYIRRGIPTEQLEHIKCELTEAVQKFIPELNNYRLVSSTIFVGHPPCKDREEMAMVIHVASGKMAYAKRLARANGHIVQASMLEEQEKEAELHRKECPGCDERHHKIFASHKLTLKYLDEPRMFRKVQPAIMAILQGVKAL